jgi:hypothetical protein
MRYRKKSIQRFRINARRSGAGREAEEVISTVFSTAQKRPSERPNRLSLLNTSSAAKNCCEFPRIFDGIASHPSGRQARPPDYRCILQQ